MLLSLNKSTTQNLDALAVVVCEISTPKLRSNLAFILTLSISEQGVVQTPDFGKIWKVQVEVPHKTWIPLLL